MEEALVEQPQRTRMKGRSGRTGGRTSGRAGHTKARRFRPKGRNGTTAARHIPSRRRVRVVPLGAGSSQGRSSASRTSERRDDSALRGDRQTSAAASETENDCDGEQERRWARCMGAARHGAVDREDACPCPCRNKGTTKGKRAPHKKEWMRGVAHLRLGELRWLRCGAGWRRGGAPAQDRPRWADRRNRLPRRRALLSVG